MQNAKDTFYVTLRDRLAAVNPARTIVRARGDAAWRAGGGERAGCCVCAVDAFWLHWTGLKVDAKVRCRWSR